MKELTCKIIIQAYKNVKDKKEPITQFDVQDEVERILGRMLTPSEKHRVTRVLRNHVGEKKVEYHGCGVRYFYF